jgi:hypothetical protein
MEIHCHRCGGFIANPGGTMFREESAGTAPIAPHSGLCACDRAVVYGPAPEGGRSVDSIRAASDH